MNSDKTTLLQKIERSAAVRSVRGGLVTIIPVLIVGAFSLILKSFPVEQYQTAIATFADGFFLKLFDIVYNATFGALSLYMTISISSFYMGIKADHDTVKIGAILASAISFFILAGIYLDGFGVGSMNPKSMFLAILTALGASYAYCKLSLFFRSKRRVLFSSGANRVFNQMLATMMPIGIIVIGIALLNLAVMRIFGVESFRMLLVRFFDKLFSYGKVGFFKGFFFVLLSSMLWMFGIHGSDTLEDVMQTYFAPGLAQNQAALAAGNVPTTVLTKEFFDCFVLMGGCGATICLLIALLLFSKSRARRSLAATAAFPMIFNINELMVFGLPIIFNPVMLIPFFTVPLFCYSSAYLAISTGIVPAITSQVEWTTPIILGGLRATGSVAGALLQVFNVIVGVLIYMPFVHLLDRKTEEESKAAFASFVDFFKKNESALSSVKLTDFDNENGELAKLLSAEIRHDIDLGRITLAYQPQYSYAGACIGVEALLRWKYAQTVVYPPLIFKLAEDGGFLFELEEAVFKRVLADRDRVREKFGQDVKISFNITGATVVTDRFLQLLRQTNAKTPFKDMPLCVEVTEQAALIFTDQTLAAFREIRSMGLLLAIDDFSMGQTSIQYLKENTFDIIKLDGSLVQGLSTHANCREIISSIVQLSATLHMTVLAEFVETAEQREMLHEIGCDCYQGYLYSPAVFLDE